MGVVELGNSYLKVVWLEDVFCQVRLSDVAKTILRAAVNMI